MIDLYEVDIFYYQLSGCQNLYYKIKIYYKLATLFTEFHKKGKFKAAATIVVHKSTVNKNSLTHTKKIKKNINILNKIIERIIYNII